MLHRWEEAGAVGEPCAPHVTLCAHLDRSLPQAMDRGSSGGVSLVSGPFAAPPLQRHSAPRMLSVIHEAPPGGSEDGQPGEGLQRAWSVAY